MKPIHAIFAASLMAAVALPGATRADEMSAWRAFVSDQATGTVSVLDLEDGTVIERFALEAPTSLYATTSGAHVFAVQGDANIVQAIATGIEIDDHGDHGDIEISDPALLSASVTGERPVHFVEHRGQIALFFDGDGTVKIVDETGFGDDDFRTVDSGAAHHGVAAAYGNYVIVTEPHPQDPSNLPVGVNVLDGEDARIGETYPCPGLHGEASSGNVMAIACDTGLLLVTDSASGPQISHLPYGEGLPEGKTSTLLGGVGIQYFIGNYGADRVVIIDPAGPDFTLVDLPTRRVHFAVDPARPQYAYIFTEDGNLHRLHILSGEIEETLSLTEPYSMDGHWSDPRPRVAVAGDEILVTDPLQSLVHRIDAQEFTASGTIDVEGLPFNIVVAGGSGQVH